MTEIVFERFDSEPWDEGEEDTDSYGMRHIHEDEEEGCCFPDKCIMGGLHLRSECCTAEMMQQMYEDGEA